MRHPTDCNSDLYIYDCMPEKTYSVVNTRIKYLQSLKTQKNPMKPGKTQKNPGGLGFKKKKRVFANPDLIEY